MGKVFTWDQVKNREIPAVQEIVNVTSQVKALLSAEPDVLAGVVYGSYIHNALNIRSDVDMMVVYRAGSQRIKNRVAEALHIAGGVSVSLEITTIDEEIAATKLHDYGPLMLAHLACAVNKQGPIKENPCKWLSPNVGSADEDVRNYLRHKRAFFEDRGNYLFYLSESEMYHLLRKILEVAIHVGRRVIALTDGPRAADSRRAVLERYPQVASQRAEELFHYLVAADDAYTRDLEKQLAGSSGEAEERHYRKTIRSIQAALPLAFDFVRQNSLMIDGR